MPAVSMALDGLSSGDFRMVAPTLDNGMDFARISDLTQHAEISVCMCEGCTKARSDEDGTDSPQGPEPFDAPGTVATTVSVVFGGSVADSLTPGDHDWFRVNLTAGQSYTFWTSGTGGSGEPDTFLSLRNSNGTAIITDDDGGQGTLSLISFTATTTGTYYLDVGGFGDGETGDYSLFASNGLWNPADAVRDNASTGASVAVGGSTTVTLNGLGDHDWYAVTLTAGQRYVFETSGATAVDTFLTIRDASGAGLGENDDGASGTFSRLVFTPTTSGTYYLDVSGWRESAQGSFTLSVGEAPPLTAWTNDQIADQLTTGYWTTPHHFNVAPGGTLTVDLSALTSEGQFLARSALAMWTDFTGINFTEQTGSAQITFDDNQDGAFANASYTAAGVTTSANVNVGTGWLTNYGTTLNSYSFQTYVHEIGHALGLGHGGNYNSTADYPTDASYLNDAWVTTVMSYFDVNENTYFANLGFTRQYTVTPMAADGIAVADLYGAVTTTRTGNTTYGFNNNSGRDIYNAQLYANVSYTIIDNGGIDTLNYSGFSADQLINLNQEAFSNIGGRVGNVVIARGTVIENATGGSGADTIVGNAANNVLNGGAGADRLYGGQGDDQFYVDVQSDVVFEFAGQGTDTVFAGASYYLYANIENLTLTGDGNLFGVGNDLANTILGNVGSNLLIGGAGNDVIRGSDGVDSLFGESGADQLFGDAGIDYLVGGIGNDTLDGGADADSLYGEDGDDVLIGGTSFHTDILVGGAGNDTLRGNSGLGDYDLMDGGAGNDSYYVDTPDDLTFEAANGGVDTVYATINGAGYYLYANVENLVLGGNTPFGVGNDLANRITGSAASNWLLGGAGNDVLNGAGGNDVLFGEAGADIFVFQAGTGGDVIGDFVAGTDRIDLSAFGLTWQTVANSMHENGGTTAIDLGNGDYIVLNGVARSALDQDDFILSGGSAADPMDDLSATAGTDDPQFGWNDNLAVREHAQFAWNLVA
ncbi:M10 family metallopeptidase C-terminal domain-containing protein [Sphingomonas sp. ST-64]|uniref:M10 family metallopeptidase C-terminal domain-containing protein n=1 Tax=Sphingomonas plantiphila TaxID=3163295 RepID=A0ABW8YKF9_9SPHN